jgi:flagellar assembly protein FliH
VNRVPAAPEAGSPTAVLRDVVFQQQPHALQRPVQRLVAVPSAAAMVPADPAHEPALQSAAAREPTYEDGLADGYEQGYAAARAAAVREASLEHEQALQAERQRAADEGLRDGYQKGLENASAQNLGTLQAALDEMRAEQRGVLQQLEQLLAALPGQLRERLAAAEDDMVALCHEVLCRMLGQAMATPEAVRAMLDQVRSQMLAQGQVAVHLHPDDWDLTRECEALRALEGIEWVADSQVALGGLLLRSPQGSLDARLEVQLEQLKAALLTARARRRATPGPRPEARP